MMASLISWIILNIIILLNTESSNGATEYSRNGENLQNVPNIVGYFTGIKLEKKKTLQISQMEILNLLHHLLYT